MKNLKGIRESKDPRGTGRSSGNFEPEIDRQRSKD